MEMIRYKMKNHLLGLALLLTNVVFLSSCADEQDFDQFDDLSVEPLVASSIFYFESDEQTINQAGPGAFYNQNFTFEAFNQPFVSERVLEGTIVYQVENTTSKELSISIAFLDANGAVLDVESFIVPPEPAPLIERQIAYGTAGRSLDILRNTTDIRVSGENLGDTTSTSSLNEPKIILRSSAEFRLRLQ